MSVLVHEVQLESVERTVAVDVGTSLLQNDPNSPFHAVVDNQDLIEERCLLIWADIETPTLKTTGRVGFCTVRVCEEFVELYRFYVAPDFRRLGVARRALALLAEYISNEGFSEFYIEATTKEASEFWAVAARDFAVFEAGHMKWRLSFSPEDLAARGASSDDSSPETGPA
ncbi:GNAT family N-acetyltransferase [Pseudomonas sp. NY15463]|uniref:GNAT family N-acetyltransferase n=1 Tax=Pseudomonas sp. NY15463 TaxID=3400361 RepID=UPI003A8BAB81